MSGITAMIAVAAATLPLTATVDTTNASGTAASQVVTAAGHGGAPGYTYLWQKISGDAAVTAQSPNNASTFFSGIGFATFKCKVTDAAGQIAFTPVVSVTISAPPIG